MTASPAHSWGKLDSVLIQSRQISGKKTSASVIFTLSFLFRYLQYPPLAWPESASGCCFNKSITQIFLDKPGKQSGCTDHECVIQDNATSLGGRNTRNISLTTSITHPWWLRAGCMSHTSSAFYLSRKYFYGINSVPDTVTSTSVIWTYLFFF